MPQPASFSYVNTENQPFNSTAVVARGQQVLYFKHGQLYKIVGDQNNWYDPAYIVSDGIEYDLSSKIDISKIQVPSFVIDDVLSGRGATGSLDYVLRMKSSNCFNRHEYELCSALLWKSTEIMFANRFCAWRNADYERLVKWHDEMGMHDEAIRARKYLENHDIFMIGYSHGQKQRGPKTKPAYKPPKDHIPYHEKELLLTQRTSIEDMRAIPNSPFAWNSPVKKHIAERSHPFAYMDIVGVNIDNVKRELQKMNNQISLDEKSYPKLINGTRIPLEKITFKPSMEYGHTKIICTPKTLTGKLAKYPFKLFFCTDLSSMNETHGEIIYDQSGNIASANIYCWKNGSGSLLYYKSVEGKLVLSSGEKAGYNK